MVSCICASISNAPAPTQSTANRDAALKQKCQEELVLWEAEPMPDLTTEPKIDQCAFWSNQPDGKYPTLKVLAAGFFGRQLGSSPSERHWSKCKNTTGTKRTRLEGTTLNKLMIINTCMKANRGIMYDGDPIRPNPFLDSHLNRQACTQEREYEALQQQELPEETDDEEENYEVGYVPVGNETEAVLAEDSELEEEVQEAKTPHNPGDDMEVPESEQRSPAPLRSHASVRSPRMAVQETQIDVSEEEEMSDALIS